MPEFTVTRTMIVTDPVGLHIRSALAIAQAVNRGGSRVVIVKGQQRVEATEVLQVMTLVAQQGDALTFEADGPDADAVLDSLEPLLAGQFSGETKK